MRPTWVLALLLAACSDPAGVSPDEGAMPAPDAAAPAPVCSAGGLPGLPAFVSAGPDGWIATCGHTLSVSFVDEGTVRLRHTGAPPAPRRSWAVVGASLPSAAQAGHTADGALVACTAALTLTVDADCRVRLVDAAGTVLAEDAPGWSPTTGTLTRALTDGEHLYGLGSQTGTLDRRGRHFTLWNTDAYDPVHGGFAPDAAPLYPSIPFFIGLRQSTAYGVFVDDSHRLEVDLGASDPARWQIHTPADELDEYLFAGPRMADVIDHYTRLTGRPALPPRWALGFHQSRWGYHPDSAIDDVAATLRAHHLPADGLWLDIQHMRDFRSFTWDPQGFADPAGLVQRLSAGGFKTTLIVDPGIKVDDGWDVYQSGLTQGAFLVDHGVPYVGNAWPGPVVFPDFSAPAARAWWGGLVAGPLALGVRGLWIDLNEPTNLTPPQVPDTIAVHGDGVPTTMAELHNAYALLEAQATFDGMRAAAPQHRPLIVSRAGYAGLQRYAGVWTGDAPSTFVTLNETLPMMIGIGLSGVPLVGSDVGGYSGHATPELYARWMALGALSPFYRAHVTSGVPGQEPWQFGFEVEDISRALLRERYALLPYWYSLFAQAAETGAPPLRPLVYEFPDDAAAATLGDEAMLGPFLLYAPVTAAGATTRAVHLPPGRWSELRSGRVYAGGTAVTRDLTLAELPVFVRAGAILPRGPALQWSDQAPLDPLTLDVWPGDSPSQFTFYEDAGDGDAGGMRITYTQSADAGGATLVAGPRSGPFAPPARTLSVRLHGVAAAPTAVLLDGTPLPFAWDTADASLEVHFPDRADFALVARWDRSVPVADTVQVPLHVTGGATHVATSANGWTQQPLTVQPDGSASGVVPVPRGAWFYFKYTRGGWSTVEKAGDCAELGNRYAFGAAHPGRSDVVARFADGCP